MPLFSRPIVPVGRKPTPASFLGPSSVRRSWWRGLVCGWPFWEGAGYPKELISGLEPNDGLGLGQVWEMRPGGPAFFADANDRWGYTTAITPQLGMANGGLVDAVTVFYRWFYTGPAEAGGDLWSLLDNTSGSRIFVGEGSATDDNVAYVLGHSGGNTGAGTGNSSSFNVGDEIVCLVTMRPDATTSPRFRTYINGVLDADTTGSIVSAGSFDFSNSDFSFNGRIASSLDDYQGSSDVCWVWNRELHPVEIANLIADPFAPVRSYTSIGFAAAAAPPATDARTRSRLMLMGVGI